MHNSSKYIYYLILYVACNIAGNLNILHNMAHLKYFSLDFNKVFIITSSYIYYYQEYYIFSLSFCVVFYAVEHIF
jgi:hypothetical protein